MEAWSVLGISVGFPMEGVLGISVDFPMKGAAHMPVSRDGNQWCFAFLPLSCHELSDAPPW